MSLLNPPQFDALSPEEMWATNAETPSSFRDYMGLSAEQGATESLFGVGSQVGPDYQPPMSGGIFGQPALQQPSGTPRLTEDQWKASKNYRPEIPYDPGMTEAKAEFLKQQFDHRRWRDSVYQRYQGGFLGRAAGIGAMLVGGALSPENYVPILGPASRAYMAARLGRVGAYAAAGAIEGAVGNLAVAPYVYQGLAAQGEDVGIEDVALDVAMGAVLGSAFSTGVGVWGDRVARSRAMREAAISGKGGTVHAMTDALNLASDAVERGDVPDVARVVAPEVERARGVVARMPDAEAVARSADGGNYFLPERAAEMRATLSPGGVAVVSAPTSAPARDAATIPTAAIAADASRAIRTKLDYGFGPDEIRRQIEASQGTPEVQAAMLSALDRLSPPGRSVPPQTQSSGPAVATATPAERAANPFQQVEPVNFDPRLGYRRYLAQVGTNAAAVIRKEFQAGASREDLLKQIDATEATTQDKAVMRATLDRLTPSGNSSLRYPPGWVNLTKEGPPTIDRAHDWVRAQGLKTGTSQEFIAVFDADGKLVDAGTTGKQDTVAYPPAITDWYGSRKKLYRVTHNHPSSCGLGRFDLGGLFLGPVDEIAAIGHAADKPFYRASLRPEVVAAMDGKWGQPAAANLRKVYGKIHERLHSFVYNRHTFDKGTLGLLDAPFVHLRLAGKVLADAGVIKLDELRVDPIPAGLVTDSQFGELMARLTASVIIDRSLPYGITFDPAARGAGAGAAAGDIRPAGADGTGREVGRAGEVAVQPSAGRPGLGAVGEMGGGNGGLAPSTARLDPDPEPPSVTEAAARVGKDTPELQQFAEDAGLEDESIVAADLNELRRAGTLTAEDEAALKAADEDVKMAESAATAYETLSTCVLRYST